MEIRFAEEKDIDGILILLEQVNLVHYKLRPDLFEKTTKYNREELSNLINDPMHPIVVCTDENDEVLGHGFCIIQDYTNVDLWTNIKSLYIDDICVDENKRRMGIAGKIFDFIKQYANENGFYNITLNVWEGNDSAATFYKSLGMTCQKTTLETIL